MAQFSYEAYSQQAAAKRSTSAGGGRQNPTHFINEWLKNDGDSVVVRFPYHSMDDIQFETTHTVTFPGDKYGKRVRCEGADCPLCKQGVKVDTRFFVKAIVYVTDPVNGTVSLVPAIWDRPAAFADIDLKNLIAEYDDLTQNLFKIKRNGSGLDTRYTISIIMNKTVYNPDVYKADFTGLSDIDPVKVMTRTVEQYMKALNPESAQQESKNLETVISTPEEHRAVEEALGMPAEEPAPTPAPQPQTNSNPQAADRPKRYTF